MNNPINIPLNVVDFPNRAGEILRAYFFNQEDGEYGCYSTFETHFPLKELGPVFPNINNEYVKQIKWRGCKDPLTDICMEYYWDGDGTLVFYLPNEKCLVNNDCKKSYNWEWWDSREFRESMKNWNY